ncbi:FixH family protein [Sulfurovum sp. zt1-1]|uniref:FixH family protein n=1 Tax=Sulfurovum zhangzhouensis TaxID=3019067 RepID=A0ABT7QZS1_9BACT|nr:FixH family protein [Sulfurovum zhangzhouensis]MDM5272308.1 FixH family protein [Sulfurovum zhangzhouensis]
MANNKEKTYWPHMILGFFFLGITLGYWTVKTASNMPVQESNDYMMKYQSADMNINDIMEKKIAFDKEYMIELIGKETMEVPDNVNSNKVQMDPVKLSKGLNEFTYMVIKNNGSVVSDANVSFLLTRPHTRADDFVVDSVPYGSGEYIIKDINITKPGRYTLQLRAKVGDAIGYSEIPAYLR